MIKRKLMMVIPGMDTGGAELQLMQQLNLFLELDITLSVLSDRVGLLPNLPNSQKVIVYNQPALRHLNISGIFKAIPIAWKMMRYCRAEKISCVIAHLPMAHWTARLVALFSLNRIRVIAYHHSEQYKANPVKGLFQRVFISFQSVLSRLTDSGNIFVSETTKDDIEKHQFVRNGIVVKNLVHEVKSDSKLAEEKLPVRKFQKYIVIPGRIERVKGQVFFIKALTPELISKIQQTNTLIVFAGGGSDEKELAQNIPADIKENVFITDTLNHAALLSFLSLADLVIIPSLSEGFGITLVESMMLKRNILSSNAGGLKETIESSKAIEWFETANTEQLQEKITDWFENRLTFQSQKAYAYYRDNFSPEMHREAFLRYLDQTL